MILSAAYANDDHTSAIIQTDTSGAIAISERDTPDLWEQMLELGSISPFTGPSLSDVKLRLRAAIDTAAEAERLKYITPGAGQALAYEAKRTEVARWRAAGSPASPDAEDYPWAADRADRLATTVAAVLAEWAAQADAWAAIGIAIEREREAAKEAITAAADAAAAQAAVDAVVWPSI